jgi:hypothetical protein
VTNGRKFRVANPESGRPPTGVEEMADEKDMRKAALAAAGGGLLLFVLWYIGWSRPPQVGGNKESLKVVEALYTAVSSHNLERLAQCEEQLRTLRDDGKLPRPPADYLDGLIRTARGGNWRGATRKIFDFMRAQRREGA